MAQISDILSVEKERSDENRYVIHFYQEGSFYRAYEWSAWLFVSKLHEFKITHRSLKNIEGTVIFIGFPVSSIEKFTPVGSQMETVAEKCVDLILPEIMFQEERTTDEMRTAFEEWKAGVPVAETDSRRKDKESASSAAVPADQSVKGGGHDAGHIVRMSEIMQRIMSFPIEQKSPMESMIFLSEIKAQIAMMV